MKWLAVLALTGCDAVFGSTFTAVDAPISPDAPPGCAVATDEDCDGLFDDVDPCPLHPGTAANEDSDEIGDDCDPDRTTPGDARVWLDRLDTDRGWNADSGTWTFDGGRLRLDPGGGVDVVAIDPNAVRASIVMRISDVVLPEDGSELGLRIADGTVSFGCGVRREKDERMLGVEVTEPILKPFPGEGPIYLTIGQRRDGKFYCRGANAGSQPLEVVSPLGSAISFEADTLAIGGTGSAVFESLLVLRAPP